jgi:hypothetical protein
MRIIADGSCVGILTEGGDCHQPPAKRGIMRMIGDL